MAFQPLPSPGLLSTPPPRPLQLLAHTRPCSFRQPYIGQSKDQCDLRNTIPIYNRNYPLVQGHPRPLLAYHAYYCDPDQETSETESVGSSIGFDLKKPEEYRIPGMLIFYCLLKASNI